VDFFPSCFQDNDKEKPPSIQIEKLNLKENQNVTNKNMTPINVKMNKPNHSPTTPGVKEKSQNTNNSNKKEQQKSKDNKR
jgi:hypothetical protein